MTSLDSVTVYSSLRAETSMPRDCANSRPAVNPFRFASRTPAFFFPNLNSTALLTDSGGMPKSSARMPRVTMFLAAFVPVAFVASSMNGTGIHVAFSAAGICTSEMGVGSAAS